jgi:RPA family protein
VDSSESTDVGGVRLVAYLDDGGRVYRTRMDEKILLDDIHGGNASSDWTEIIDQAMEKLHGRYCTVSGYLNEDVDASSTGFSGLVAGELRWGVRVDFMSVTSPSFEVRPKPHVRVFNTELNRTTAATDYGGQEGRVNYALLPTGHKANKVLVVGTLSRIRSTGKAIGGRLTDATGSTVEFFVPKEERPQVANSLLDLRDSGLPCRIGILANVRPGDNSEVIVSLQNFFEADEFVEETWIRETVERTRQRVLEKPYEDETQSEYGVPPEKVWNDIKRRLVKNSRVGSQVV